MSDILAQYTFMPWLRRGLANEIEEVDTLGAGDGTAIERAELPTELELEGTAIAGGASAHTIAKQLALIGPGDIANLKQQSILRVQPHPGATNFEASGLPYVEFYEEDFPWRYTPARPADLSGPAAQHHKLRPWIALWVLQEDEFETQPPRPDSPPTIRLVAEHVARALPLHNETWAWAHAQISRVVAAAAQVDGAIRSAPDHALSRLVCPRRLEPETRYHAFLVPAFETGRLAGLGEDTTTVRAQAPSWVSGSMPHSPTRPLEYPVYHQWSFMTGLHGDFESLVRALIPGPVGADFGKRAMDVSQPGFGMDGVARAPSQLEGALKPPEFSPTRFPNSPGAAFANRLEKVLDLSENLEAGRAPGLNHPFHVVGSSEAYSADLPDDPIVTPPAYGRHHAAVNRVADARGVADLAWLRELNLDPRSRAAAGLGVEVVQKRQDELMERAWQQVGELEAANQRLREAELAVTVGESLFSKHLVLNDGDRALRLTAAAQKRIIGRRDVTVRAEVQSSQVPVAAQAGAFKRISRPQRKVVRRLAGSGSVQGLQQNLIQSFDSALSAAQPRPEPSAALTFSAVSTAVQTSINEFSDRGTQPGHLFLELVVASLKEIIDNGSVLSRPNLRNKLNQLLNQRIPGGSPSEALEKKTIVQQLINAIQSLDAGAEPETFNVEISAAAFELSYGTDIVGKSLRGVTVRNQSAGDGEVARMTAVGDLENYSDALSGFNQQLTTERVEPPPAGPLGNVGGLAGTTLGRLRPKHAMVERVRKVLPGVSLPEAVEPRRLRPVMAHPKFPDPMFEDLRRKSQDFIIPNYSDLPDDTLTLLESNPRFIHSFMAGLNEEMSRELLWREYPTDLRGTYFRTFWDTRDDLNEGDSDPDIRSMHEWRGQLARQSGRSGGFLVLVIRGQLFKKFPNTVVYAQKAVFAGQDRDAARQLSDENDRRNLLFPAFQGELDPDIAIFGFALTKERAKGDRARGRPGWFFVLKERPGEVHFGLDEPVDGVPALDNWNELNWGHLNFPANSPRHIALTANNLNLVPGAEPSEPTAGQWAKSAADMAYILFQNPVLFARHAAELLP